VGLRIARGCRGLRARGEDGRDGEMRVRLPSAEWGAGARIARMEGARLASLAGCGRHWLCGRESWRRGHSNSVNAHNMTQHHCT
jgi:hypothetical protein